jgi:hypothetical protein
MTPGPTLIRKCPGCARLLKFATIGSGNTFGATYWTDGKCEAPMLPDEPWLRKSPSEGVLFWMDECEDAGEISPWEEAENPEWEDLEFAQTPSETDYVSALNAGMGAAPERLRYLRTRLWWAANDRLRTGAANRTEDFWTPEVVTNLRELVRLLDDEDDESRLMRAEALRELADFDGASTVLAASYPPEFAPALQTIRGLVAQRDGYVREIPCD